MWLMDVMLLENYCFHLYRHSDRYITEVRPWVPFIVLAFILYFKQN